MFIYCNTKCFKLLIVETNRYIIIFYGMAKFKIHRFPIKFFKRKIKGKKGLSFYRACAYTNTN